MSNSPAGTPTPSDIMNAIGRLDANLTSLQREVSGDLKAMKTELAGLKDSMTVVNEDLTGLKGAMTVVNEDLTGLKDSMTVVNEDLTGLKDSMTVVNEDLTGLKDSMTVVNEDLTGLKDAMTVVKEDLAGLRATVNSELPQMRAELSALEGRLEFYMYYVAANPRDIQADISRLKSDFNKQRRKIAAIRDTLSAADLPVQDD